MAAGRAGIPDHGAPVKLSLANPDGRRADVEPYAEEAAVRLSDRLGTVRYYLTDPTTAANDARAHVAHTPKVPK